MKPISNKIEGLDLTKNVLPQLEGVANEHIERVLDVMRQVRANADTPPPWLVDRLNELTAASAEIFLSCFLDNHDHFMHTLRTVIWLTAQDLIKQVDFHDQLESQVKSPSMPPEGVLLN